MAGVLASCSEAWRMRDLDDSLIAEKNKLFSEYPWIWLFEVEIDAATMWRFCGYWDDITWNGYTWSAIAAGVESISFESSGRLGTFNAHVSNVALQVSSYQENADLTGNNVTLYLVNHGHLDKTAVINFTFQINTIQRTDTDAIFELGYTDLFLLQLPRVRDIRNRCPYFFRDARCGYPNDEFTATTEQDLRLGGDGDKGSGWATLNMTNAAVADINRTNAGQLTVKTAASGPYSFLGSVRTAPQVYKTFSGNFDFYTRLPGGVVGDALAGFYVQSANDASDSVAWVVRETSGTDHLYTRNTINDISSDVQRTTMRANMRIARSGSTFRFYAKADTDSDWTLYYTVTRQDFPSIVYVGFCFPTTTTAIGEPISFDYFRAYSGGAASCDRGFDTPNGCRSKQWQPFFGGAAGLPYGRVGV